MDANGFKLNQEQPFKLESSSATHVSTPVWSLVLPLQVPLLTRKQQRGLPDNVEEDSEEEKPNGKGKPKAKAKSRAKAKAKAKSKAKSAPKGLAKKKQQKPEDDDKDNSDASGAAASKPKASKTGNQSKAEPKTKTTKTKAEKDNHEKKSKQTKPKATDKDKKMDIENEDSTTKVDKPRKRPSTSSKNTEPEKKKSCGTWAGRWRPTDEVGIKKMDSIRSVFDQFILQKVRRPSALTPMFYTMCSKAFIEQGLSDAASFDDYVAVAELKVEEFMQTERVRSFGFSLQHELFFCYNIYISYIYR